MVSHPGQYGNAPFPGGQAAAGGSQQLGQTQIDFSDDSEDGGCFSDAAIRRGECCRKGGVESYLPQFDLVVHPFLSRFHQESLLDLDVAAGSDCRDHPPFSLLVSHIYSGETFQKMNQRQADPSIHIKTVPKITVKIHKL